MNWEEVPFESLYAIPSRNGVYKSQEFRGSGYRMVNMGELFGYDFISSQEMSRIQLKETEYEANRLDDGDLLFGRRSLIESGAGKCSIVVSPAEPMVFESSIIRVRVDKTKTNPRFLFYYFASHQGRGRVLSIVSGTNVKGIRGSDLKTLLVINPPLLTQDRIVDILSAYDDLIENNRRRIDLLEQSARMLYKEWFVSLRYPGHEHVKIKDGVPDGWEKKLIGDVCQTIGGGTPSTQKREYWDDGDITWVTPTDVTRNDCLALLDSEKKITDAGLRESSAKLVPPDTILMTSRASIGFFAMMDKEASTNQGFISIIPNEPSLRMYMLHNLINRVEEIRSNAGGTTFKEITKSRFRSMSIIIPSQPLLAQFEDSAYMILQQTRLLKKQIRGLQQARDLLLPRLMNGELAV